MYIRCGMFAREWESARCLKLQLSCRNWRTVEIMFTYTVKVEIIIRNTRHERLQTGIGLHRLSNSVVSGDHEWHPKSLTYCSNRALPLTHGLCVTATFLVQFPLFLKRAHEPFWSDHEEYILYLFVKTYSEAWTVNVLWMDVLPVSYTHLTLPTNREV